MIPSQCVQGTDSKLRIASNTVSTSEKEAPLGLAMPDDLDTGYRQSVCLLPFFPLFLLTHSAAHRSRATKYTLRTIWFGSLGHTIPLCQDIDDRFMKLVSERYNNREASLGSPYSSYQRWSGYSHPCIPHHHFFTSCSPRTSP